MSVFLRADVSISQGRSMSVFLRAGVRISQGRSRPMSVFLREVLCRYFSGRCWYSGWIVVFLRSHIRDFGIQYRPNTNGP